MDTTLEQVLVSLADRLLTDITVDVMNYLSRKGMDFSVIDPSIDVAKAIKIVLKAYLSTLSVGQSTHLFLGIQV